MSGSVSSTAGLSTAASTAAAAAATSTTTGSAAAPNALASLTTNFNSFLNLLMTQLKNQDPSSPMDSSTFTTELVQFSSVEQQITTNSSLTSLIQATQGTEVIQATGVVGKQVTVNSAQLPLQNGTGSLSFTTAAAEPVSIAVQNSSGVTVLNESLTSNAGSNTWNWNGQDSTGTQLPDGAYAVTVTGTTAGSAAAPVPFTVTGTATGVTNSNGAVTLQLGAVSADFSKVVSVGSSQSTTASN